jgi:hypothetical protein
VGGGVAELVWEAGLTTSIVSSSANSISSLNARVGSSSHGGTSVFFHTRG